MVHQLTQGSVSVVSASGWEVVVHAGLIAMTVGSAVASAWEDAGRVPLGGTLEGCVFVCDV